jgi:hypothetical protein
LGENQEKDHRFGLHQLRNCLALLLLTRSEEEEDGSCDRIKNSGGDVVRGREFHDRTRQEASGRRKIEISRLHLLNTSNLAG